VAFVKGKIEEDIKIIMAYIKVIWLCKMIRRTNYSLLILTSYFGGELCEEKGENKNSRAVNRPERGVAVQLS